jgi:hypothetical protein
LLQEGASHVAASSVFISSLEKSLAFWAIKCITGNEILQNEVTGTQTRFSTNIGGKLRFIPSFLFPGRLHHCCYIYFYCSYLYNYYNHSRTLCIKLIKFHYFADAPERGDRVVKERVTLQITLLITNGKVLSSNFTFSRIGFRVEAILME